MSLKYEKILADFYANKWAITERWHSNIESILRDRAQGNRLSDEERQERIEAARADYRQTRSSNNDEATEIAIIELQGPIVPRATMYSEISGGASHQAFAKAVMAAADDDAVAEIILDVSSPGGTVEGVDTSSEAVRYAAGKKPVTAVAGGMMCSAAYWICSQATKIVASPSSEVGSIGVLCGHTDMTKLEENLGLKTTIFRSGPKKAIGHPSESLSDDARTEIQREIDDIFAVFIGDVAAGRDRKPADVRAEWGEGQVWVADEALKLGLIDEIGTLSSVLGKTPAASSPRRRRGAKGASVEPEEINIVEMTPEQLEAANPELFKQVKALGFAEGQTAGIEQGKTLAVAESGDESLVVRLEQTVAKLSSKLEQSEKDARKEKRTGIAISALEAANFGAREWPQVEGMDLESNFRDRLEDKVQAAATDDEARAVAKTMCAEQIAFLPLKDKKAHQTPRERKPLVPGGDNSRAVDSSRSTQAEGSGNKTVVRNIRQDLNLPS